MDFANKNLWPLFQWEGGVFYVTESMLASWIIMAVLVLFAVIVRIKLKSFQEVPKGFQNVVEAAVEMMSDFAKSTMGEGMEFFGGYFFGVFAFILLSNYSGLVGLRPPTADLAATAALALCTFVLIHVTGIKRRGGRYFKEYFAPNPVFFVLNVVGELSKPISLAFRLFGNMLGGTIIIGLVYAMLPVALRIALPGVLHIYFDIFAGALQAFIFTVLSMTFITQKAVEQ